MKKIIVFIVILFSFRLVHAEEIGFREDFSLSGDRMDALQQLIPGTEDFYYFHCLYYQHTGQFSKVRSLLKQWTKRYNYTSRVYEIEYRQALLSYKENPAKSLDYIKRALGLWFSHQKQELDPQTHHATRLDQKFISRDAFKKRAYSHYTNLYGFEDSAFDFLIAENLNRDRLRNLLSRLKRPDYLNLPELIVKDLKAKHSGGFGSHSIHKQLLLSQLNRCLELMPKLVRDTAFIRIYLSKLQPNEDVNFVYDNKEKREFLDRLWAFAKKLPPAENSLKAHILYQQLLLDEKEGLLDHTLFLEYLKLPRNAQYMKPDYIRSREHQGYQVNLNAAPHVFTKLPVIGDDEPLVRRYFQRIFVTANNYNAYSFYVKQAYLKEVFAETKMLYGIGDREEWYSWLSPSHVQFLKEHVEIEFLPVNKDIFSTEDNVALDVFIKNVPSLLVKTYKVNAFNYYQEYGKEISTGIDLDGLVAHEEKIFSYNEAPIRRHAQHFVFPKINQPGIYVVEFIGNGRSSRALIRKGRLSFVQNISAAGHVFRIYDENKKLQQSSRLWLSGHEYLSNNEGEIIVPFTNKAGKQDIIISSGEFSTLHHFDHMSEKYSLFAGIHVSRESLLKDHTCKVLLRPQLFVNNKAIGIDLLEEVTLVIESTDREGIQSTQEIKDFKLNEGEDAVHEFKVPENLSLICFTLKGKVENLSQGKKKDLIAKRSFSINGIEKTETIEDLYFRQLKGRYEMELFGKNGESKKNRPVTVTVKHRDFTETPSVMLQTDERGRIDLGALKDITWVKAKSSQGVEHSWDLRKDQNDCPQSIHGLADSVIKVPFMGDLTGPLGKAISLLETRGNTFVRDYKDHASLQDGFLVVKGLPPGNFELLFKKQNIPVHIRITKGEKEAEGFLLSDDRILESQDSEFLHIKKIILENKDVRVFLANATPETRVHVIATRFKSPFAAFDNLILPQTSLGVKPLNRLISQYVSGRNIGDEYRYILERKNARKFPGNMLKRPSLILNPWSLRKTDTGKQQAKEGEEWKDMPVESQLGLPSSLARLIMPSEVPVSIQQDFSTMDFLPEASFVAYNLRPDEKGMVTIDKSTINARQQVHIIALDERSTIYRTIFLPRQEEQYKDLRLRNPLEVKNHYTEQKNVTVARKDKDFIIEDITTSKVEVYDSLSKVYQLFVTLSKNPTLIEFGFLRTWPDLEFKKKKELYAKYACHELNFFLFKKDVELFKTVIGPFLQNKKDKTFMDHWLLKDNLSAYLKPWAFAQLNIVERILLAQNQSGEIALTARHVKDLFDMIPPDVERFNHFFKTALKGRSLEAGDELNLGLLYEMSLSESISGNESVVVGGAAFSDEEYDKESSLDSFNGRLESLQKVNEAGFKKDLKREKSKKRELKNLKSQFGERERRDQMRQFYRKLDKTEEWVENNYYHLPIEQQRADLVTVNAFWKDYVNHSKEGSFLSSHFPEASHNFTEMMFALSVLDIPFEEKEKQSELNTSFSNARMILVPKNDVILFHKEIKETKKSNKAQTILVSQNFFAHNDRYRYENNEQFDKFITEEFQSRRVYGCQIVLTNPTSSRKKVDVLLQIPEGAMPVLNGFYTRSIHQVLGPYSTRTIDYFFYFPEPGLYRHYPIHVSENETLLAFSGHFSFNVVKKLSRIDKTSWFYVSQYGTDQDVLQFLAQHNVERLDLSLIAFRMRKEAFFTATINQLQARHIYNDILWSYGIFHNHVSVIREYLQHSSYAEKCGLFIDSELLKLDPVMRQTYQHKEYWPLVNSRTYRLGKKRKILNRQFFQQYDQFLKVLQYHPKLNDADLLAVTDYLLLQDRVEEALAFFNKINPGAVSSLLFDYMKAYLAFAQERPEEAFEIAQKYTEYPVDHWQKRFLNIQAQVNEIRGKAATLVDKENRDQKQTQLADTSPSFDFKVEDRKIKVSFQNLKTININYYLMDIELLFSKSPFVQQGNQQFSMVYPNGSGSFPLPEKQNTFILNLPEQYHDQNVMIEIKASGIKKSLAYFPHSLNIQLLENYGQLHVLDEQDQKPLSKVYVKVYARMKGGRVEYYKDGYTDLRGRFDYASLNTNELERVEKFAILIMSEDNGAIIRESLPPKQ